MLKSLSKNSKRWQVWLTQSYFDLSAAKLSIENGYYEWATFQCEQCVEKALKAIIVKSGFRPPKVHKISVLISMSNRADRDFSNITIKFRTIEGFTFISRYPFLIPGEQSSPHEYIKFEDAELCLNEATETFWIIKNYLYSPENILEEKNVQNQHIQNSTS